MTISFKDKTVVVVGGSTGIGFATAKSFLDAGANVVYAGLEKESELEERLESKDAICYYRQLDATSETQMQEFTQFVKEEAGGCDVLFNNAGILMSKLLHEMSLEEWQRVMTVNLNSTFLGCKYFIPQMLEKGKGSIVNMSSVSGVLADHGFPAYNASKAAIANVTRNLAIDYAANNIRVNSVAPGSVKTRIYDNFANEVGGQEILDAGTNEVYPMGRIATCQEVANAVLFLASDLASFITGHNLLIDGGLTASTGAQHQWDRVREYYKIKSI